MAVREIVHVMAVVLCRGTSENFTLITTCEVSPNGTLSLGTKRREANMGEVSQALLVKTPSVVTPHHFLLQFFCPFQ